MENRSSRQAQELLHKSEERYRLLVEGVQDYGIFMLSPEGIVTSWNEGARRLKGYEEEEIIGKHFSIFYPEEAILNKYPDFELTEAKRLGKFEDTGWRFRKDGTTFYANVVITALYNAEKRLIGFSKITRDLTEKKETEERLRSSEEKYRLLVDGVKDYAIFLLDPEGRVTSWNEGAKRLNRYTEEEIIGKHFSIFYPEEKKKARFPEYELEQAILLGKFEDEGYRVRKDGTMFFVNALITPLYVKERLVGFSKITRDLTERKLAEEKLTLLNLELEQRVKDRTEELAKTVKDLRMMNSDLDNFIYTASHDLKAPVSNIEGLIHTLEDVLKDNEFVTPEITDLLEMINTSVLRFQNTIRDLTSINEIQKAGREDLMEIDLLEIIKDVEIGIDHLIKESKAKFDIQVENPVNFRFSRMHMRSLVYNFLTNAIKYRSLERPLIVQFNASQQGNHFVMTIKDNGLGIKEENKEKIFQLFHRLHHHVEGTGIGLYIVRKIVDNAGGRVEVTSEVDQGTTFNVYLPLAGH